MTYFLKTILATSLFALATSGCSGATETVQAVSKTTADNVVASNQSSTGYSKPSAAIDFQHDFSGRSTVGATQTVNMKVMDRYSGGTVSIKVMPSEGVNIFENNAQRVFQMGGQDNAFQIQFQANSEGIHNINVLAAATLANGQVISRSYSMPIYVGDQFKPTKQSLTARNLKDNEIQLQKQNSNGMVIMEAEETITTSD